MKDELTDALHQPEYTGENRCEACTAVNLGITGLLGALVARKSKLAGVITVGISVVLIYLRGYLVPGTPTLTKRYLPPRVLQWFGKEPDPTIHSGLGAGGSATPDRESASTDTRSETDADRELAFDGDETDDHDTEASQPSIPDPETYFLEHDVVEPCVDGDDLCLTEEFETAWFEKIDAIDTDTIEAGDAVRAFGFDDSDERAEDGDELEDTIGDTFEIEHYDDARVLKRNGTIAGKWPSQAALVADVTAAPVLEARDGNWDSYDPEVKGQLLNSLRLFLETCPTTRGDVAMDEETVESCCQSHDVLAVTCEDSGERLFEHRIDAIDA